MRPTCNYAQVVLLFARNVGRVQKLSAARVARHRWILAHAGSALYPCSLMQAKSYHQRHQRFDCQIYSGVHPPSLTSSIFCIRGLTPLAVELVQDTFL
jgi:hypothetical protein